jgi:hypothetical protein
MVDRTSMLITAATNITVSERRTGATNRIADREVLFGPIGLLRSDRIIPRGHRRKGIEAKLIGH